MFPNPFRLLVAWIRHEYARVRGFQVIAPGCVQDLRHRECQSCEFFDGFMCTKCSCLVEAKISLAQEKCPIGKWCRVWILKA